MAINKKLIHFKTKANFEKEKEAGNILDTSIVFIQDVNLIWTHGTYYCLPNDEVIITDGTEPEDGQEIWIDTSEDSTLFAVEEAPKDGKSYARQNGKWIEVSLDTSNLATKEELTQGLATKQDKGDYALKSDLSNYLAKDNTTKYTPTENYHPSTKKYVDDKPSTLKRKNGGSGVITKELTPNVYYEFGECTKLTITLAAKIPNIYNEYMFEFISGTTPTTLGLPSTVKWNGGEAPTIEASKSYIVAIVNNIAVIGGA